MVVSRANGGRGKDGMLRRFAIEAMGEICQLVPDFPKAITGTGTCYDQSAANKFYKHFIGLKRFKDVAEQRGGVTLPGHVNITRTAYRCTSHAEVSMGEITLPFSRANPMEVLHILTHYVQPKDSPWHGGEFGAIFLDFIERKYDADMKRQVKDIMIEKRLKTFVKSDASRERQSAAYFHKVTAQVPKGLVDILADLKDSGLLVDHES